MAKVSKAEAARQMQMSRTTLYKLIDTGKLSVGADGMIDTAELVRAASTFGRPGGQRGTSSVDSGEQMHVDTGTQGDGQSQRAPWTAHGRAAQVFNGRSWTDVVDTLQQTVDILREQLVDAREREQAYRTQIAHLTQLLAQSHQRYDRLLEAPKTPASLPSASPYGDVGVMDRLQLRRRIVEVLEASVTPLHHDEVRSSLGLVKNLSDTMRAMSRDGLLTRIAPGVYRVPTGTH